MFLTERIGNSAAPHDDFWYEPVGVVSASGQRVDADHARRLAAVHACTRVLAETVAQLPLVLYRRLDNGGKEKARQHPLFRVLGRRPNHWQTSFEWREMMQQHVTLRGNAYSEIITAPNGRVTALIPLHPDKVKIEMLDEHRFRYRYQDSRGQERILNRERMFHLRGLADNGIVGLNPIEVEREAVGMGLSAQEYGARFFQNDGTPPGWIEYEGTFKDPEARRNFQRQWQQSQTGANRHKTAVLEHGMKYHEVGVNHKNSQFLETRRYQNEEIARIFRVPPHKIGILDRATFSNIEQQSLEFLTDTMMPWLVRWEQALSRDVITRDDEFFFEFLSDAILRADIQSRYEAYGSAIDHGWMDRNEVRKKENMNPRPGLDEPLTPMNMREGSGEDPAPSGARHRRIQQRAAERLVNKEVIALQRESERSEPEDLVPWVHQFYQDHIGTVAKQLEMTWNAAERYCRMSVSEIEAALEMEQLSDLIDEWSHNKAAKLADWE